MSTITGIEDPAPGEPRSERGGAQECVNDIISEKLRENWKMIDIVEYLNSTHKLVGQERRKMINKVYKGLLNHFIPDYMKFILHETKRYEQQPEEAKESKLWQEA
jgi:hypothetical protein